VFAGSFLFNKFIHLTLGFLLMQGLYGATPPEGQVDPFTQATIPPGYFDLFNNDFSSRDIDRFNTWLSPTFGIVTNGILLTNEEAENEFMTLFTSGGSNALLETNHHFNYGYFTGANTYMADTWLELKVRESGVDNWYRMHHQLVFKITDEGWYLIQWEYIPPDISVPIEFQSLLPGDEGLPEQFQGFMPQYTGSSATLGLVNVWPLLIGKNFAGENELHPLEGTTHGEAIWRLKDAVALDKPTVLFFFSVQTYAYSLYPPEDMEAEMDFLSGLYESFGYEDLYIFGVTDATRDEVNWMGDAGYNQFALLLDEGSLLHANLNIDMFPYIVVFDAEGTVTGLGKTFHETTLPLIEDRIRESIDAANLTG
jgi:hypothetical protein